MSSPATMLTGRPATDDLDSSIVTDTETTMVPVMVGYLDSARGMRLRLRFDDRELVVDERPSSVTDRPAILASASGSMCRDAPQGHVTRTMKSLKQSSSRSM